MLKRQWTAGDFRYCGQPPSGGCVLKLKKPKPNASSANPAAFGRLCVETPYVASRGVLLNQPPSGGCVLKPV